MALTQLSDVIIPQVYESYGFQPDPATLHFLESPAVRTGGLLDIVANREGRVTTMPFWNDLDSTSDPNISTDNPTDIATPQKIAADEMQIRVADYNNAWSATDLAAPLAGSNPMMMIKLRTNMYWSRQIQRFLSSIALGIKNVNISGNSGDMTVDISTNNSTTADATHKFSHDAVINAIATNGEHFGDLQYMIVPMTIYFAMVKQNSITYIQPSESAIQIPVYGKQCAVLPVADSLLSELNTGASAAGYKYTSIFCGAGAFGYGQGQALNPVEVRREPLQGNGGGVEILVERKRWTFAVSGHNFTSASIAALSPTSVEWGATANWTRKFKRQNVPLAFLVTNG